MASISEGEMVKALQAGDHQVFESFMVQHEKMVLGICIKLFPSLQEKEDIVQDVFIRAYEKIGTFQGKSKLSSWLYRITVNACLMRLRTESRRKLAFGKFKGEMECSISCDPHRHIQNKELMEIFQESVNQLKEKEKRTVILRIAEEKSNEETASILGLSLPAVKSRFHRGREQLKKARINHYAMI